MVFYFHYLLSNMSSPVDRFNNASSLSVMIGTLGVTGVSYLLYKAFANRRSRYLCFFVLLYFLFIFFINLAKGVRRGQAKQTVYSYICVGNVLQRC